MATPITIQDLFKLILFLLGIGALGYLIAVLKNISKLIVKVIGIVENNEDYLTSTVKHLPDISKNINSITKITDDSMHNIMPEVDGIVHSANNITGKLESITDSIDSTTYKVSETVESVSDTINDTAYTFRNGVTSVSDYIEIITEVFNVIKNLVGKK